MNVNYMPPWTPVGQFSQNLVNELRRELTPGHPLFGLDAYPIAQRTDADDVLFQFGINQPIFAVVHLTWSGEPEPDNSWPTFESYTSMEDWVENRMSVDHREYAAGSQ